MLKRNISVLLIVLVFSVPVWAQGSTCTEYNFWTLSGGSNGNEPDNPTSLAWLQMLHNLEDQYGGIPTCTYTWVVTNPSTGAGGWGGLCYVHKYVCLAAPPLPPRNSGPENDSNCTSTTPICGHPINLANGNTFIKQIDISLPGIGGGLSLTRTWNSLWPSNQILMAPGLFGNNWKSTYEERVYQDSDGTIKYARSGGGFWSFQLWAFSGQTPSYQAIAPADVHATLLTNSTQWTVLFLDGEKRTFDAVTGVLTAIIDRNGNTTQLSYDSSQRLTTVTDAASRHLYFTYGSPTSYLVTGVSSDTGTSCAYSYDSDGRLAQVTRPGQTTINFSYNTQSFITSVTDSQGKVLESHTYDGSGRGLTSSQANGINAVTVSYGSNP